MELKNRKHPRLKEYDYSQNGAYFVTVCSKSRRCIFSQIVGRGFLDAPQINLSESGSCISGAMKYLSEHSERLNVEKYIIMPNHVHLLLMIAEEKDGGASGKPRPTNAVVPKFMSSLKRYTNRICGIDLWQTGYYDHIIRDENDYMVRYQYIETNPAKWLEDEYYSE